MSMFAHFIAFSDHRINLKGSTSFINRLQKCHLEIFERYSALDVIAENIAATVLMEVSSISSFRRQLMCKYLLI